MKKVFFLTATLAFLFSNAQELEVVSSGGDHFEGTNAQISWTVGEISVETYNNGANIVTQGFHQTNLTITKIDEDYLNNSDASVNIYPNPTSEFATIELTNAINNNFIFELNDNKGKTILKKNFEGEKEIIDFKQLAPSIYYIRVYSKDGSYIETFKVIKDKN
jgi:hypothetical protein